MQVVIGTEQLGRPIAQQFDEHEKPYVGEPSHFDAGFRVRPTRMTAAMAATLAWYWKTAAVRE